MIRRGGRSLIDHDCIRALSEEVFLCAHKVLVPLRVNDLLEVVSVVGLLDVLGQMNRQFVVVLRVRGIKTLFQDLFVPKLNAGHILLQEELAEAIAEACVGFVPIDCANVQVELSSLLGAHHFTKL